MKTAVLFVLLAAGALGVRASFPALGSPRPEPLPLVSPQVPEGIPKPEGATLRGGVKLKGTAPKRRKIATDADPKCSALHGSDQLYSDEVVVDALGNLQWALVSVKSGLGDRTFAPPPTPVVVEQKGCRFSPHVFGVMAGQDVMFRNGDDLMHIIHVIPRNNREFGFSQEKVGEERAKVFKNTETIRVKCDVHPWMAAWAVVLDHPYYSVTGPDGTYQISGLPPGTYTIEVWHEKYKPVTQEIQVKDAGTVTADFSLEGK